MPPSAKGRLFGMLCFLVSGGLFAYNWWDLLNNHQFSIKISAAAPILMFASLAIIVFPSLLGAHLSKDKKQKAALLIVLVVGGILSGVNFYAMERYLQPAARPLDRIPPMPGELAPRPSNPPENNNAGAKQGKR